MAVVPGREISTDFLIVGSGGGGLVAALKAREEGLSPMIIEKTDLLGGSTAMSGGVIWAPANRFLLQRGVEDSLEEGLAYLEEVVGQVGPNTSTSRKWAFLEGSLEMIALLEKKGVDFKFCYTPDDYPDVTGGKASGRAIEVKVTKLSDLGDWASRLRVRRSLPLNVYQDDARHIQLCFRSPRHFLATLKVIGRTARGRVQRERLLTLGAAMMAQVLIAVKNDGIAVSTNTPLLELVVENDAVVGVIAEREGERVAIRSRHGVLLAAGGFARDRELRLQNSPPPIDGSVSAANPGDTGDALRAAVAIGAQTSNLDQAIWIPAPMLNGKPSLFPWERSLPHAIVVDSSGARYMNESAPYMEAGQKMLARHQEVEAVPSWLIIDANHRRRYPFVASPPRVTPKEWIKSGSLKKAPTIEDLARQCGIDPSALRETITRFNKMAKIGVDEDFHRGESTYDRYFGDETNKPNPNLGTIERAPFYAVQMVVSDVGTVGGLVADEAGRVLREDGSAISGLYACGCTSASVHGRIYPAPGASISNTMTFGYLAARHASRGSPHPARSVLDRGR